MTVKVQMTETNINGELIFHVSVDENGCSISVLAPTPDDKRPAWQGIRLMVPQVKMMLKFLDQNRKFFGQGEFDDLPVLRGALKGKLNLPEEEE